MAAVQYGMGLGPMWLNEKAQRGRIWEMSVEEIEDEKEVLEGCSVFRVDIVEESEAKMYMKGSVYM